MADLYDIGLQTRREVLGASHVDAVIAHTNEIPQPFLDFTTRTAWGEGLDRSRRRLWWWLVGRSVRGRRRIRTSVGYAGDFTDRSLWPLGHPPARGGQSNKAAYTARTRQMTSPTPR
jgi:hypothetical protein